MKNSKKIGLSLSGGGYRAAAFHFGVLQKLKEMKILDEVDVLSTISGGSITGAFYILNKNDFESFKKLLNQSLQKSTVLRVIFSLRFLFTVLLLLLIFAVIIWHFGFSLLSFLLISAVVLLCLVFIYKVIPLSNLIQAAYRKIFFECKKLSDFESSPKIAINATNLEGGRLFTFSKDKMGDSNYGFMDEKDNEKITFKPAEFPVSAAVSASTAVPYPFNPIRIHKKHFENPEDYKKHNPSLVDGGVYDNQGLHKLTASKSSYRCDIIICSDASAPFNFKYSNINPLPLLSRVNNVMMKRIKNMQSIMHVYNNMTGLVYEIAYFSINWKYDDCLNGFVDNMKAGTVRQNVIAAHGIPVDYYKNPDDFKYDEVKNFISDKIKYYEIISDCISDDDITMISKIKTGLSALSKSQIDLLTKHAAVLTELQVRLYCPSLENN